MLARKSCGCFFLFGLVLTAGLYAANWWAISGIRDSIRDSILEETGHPPLIKGFKGILPLGRFSLNSFQAKAPIETSLLELASGSASLELSPSAFFSERYEIRDLKIGLLKTQFHHPESKTQVRANFKVEAGSSGPGPLDAPGGTLWAERLSIRADALKGEMDGKEWDLVDRATLEAAPILLLPETGLAGPVDFHLKGRFTPEENQDLFFAKGVFHSTASLELDAGLTALRFPTRMTWVDELLLQEEGVRTADLIESGSFSYRLSGTLEGETFKGRMVLRLSQPRFGKALRDLAKEASESIPIDLNLLIDSIENRAETIEIGPLELDENLVTQEIESAPLLLGGLARELFKLSAGDGAGSALKLFQRGD